MNNSTFAESWLVKCKQNNETWYSVYLSQLYRRFNTLASLCGRASWCESRPFGNHEDVISNDMTLSLSYISFFKQYAERSCSGAVGGTPLSPMEIDDSRAGDADAASMASIESSSDDADTIEDAVETVDIIDGPITQEHINQARLCNVINTVCADVLRDVLLSQFTNIHKSLLKSRTTIAGMHRIGQEQFQLIFPDPHCRYTGTVDQFDITLLYTLIRNISSCPAPVTGWGKPPTDQPRDVSLSANVERIRLLRNKVSGHSVDGKLDDQACEDYFGEIGELLNDVEAELGDKGYKGALKERQTQIITPKEAKVLRAQFESYRHQLKGIYNISFPKACFTLIVRLFVHAFFAAGDRT